MNATLLIALLASAATLAFAGEHSGKRSRVPLTPQYAQECGSCHVPYAPRLMPASSWRQVMDGLAHHFGSDATLEPAAQSEIRAWLEANAGNSKRAATPPPENRITRAAWFLHEHDEIAPETWRRASVKSPSNCAACHAGAERGEFNEHDVRIPR